MKSIGIIRNIDDLGRVVIPKEIRDSLGIEVQVEIFVDGKCVVLKKHSTTCIFCGNDENIEEYKGEKICKECFNEIKMNNINFRGDSDESH